MSEEWRDISGYEGSYQVSDRGRVRSLDRTVRGNLFQGTRFARGKLLRSRQSTSGYPLVSLCLEAEKRDLSVHRLVLRTFVGPAPGGYVCNHKDGDKTNNRRENLEWMTHEENMHHAFQNGLVSNRGEANGQSKLCPEIVGMIRQIYALAQYTQEQIGIMFGVSQSTISLIVRGETWRV